MELPTLLISGATGNIGYALVKTLSTQYRNKLNLVAGFRNNDAQIPFLRSKCVQLVQMDYNVPESVHTALSQIPVLDYLFLVPSHDPNPLEHAKTLIQAALDRKVSYIVLVSLFGCQARGGSVSSAFREIELFVSGTGIPYTILRCAPLQQNFLHLVKGFQCSIPTIQLPIGRGGFAPIHTDDVANAAAVLFDNPTLHAGKVYHLTGPETLSGVMIAGKASRGLNRPVRFVNVSLEDWISSADPEWIHQGFHELYELISKGLLAYTSPDLASLTCFKGSDLEAFFKDQSGYFQNAKL